MNSIEKEFFDNLISKGDVRFMYRYVDDEILSARKDKVEEIFNNINKLHQNITFTIEKMENNSLPFLDCEIRLKNNKLDLYHYVKPSNSNCIPHFTENISPRAHKMALLTGEINRVNNACTSKEALNEGLERTQNKFINNGYPPALVKEKIRYMKSINFENKKKQDEEEDIQKHYFKATFTGMRCDAIGKRIQKII